MPQSATTAWDIHMENLAVGYPGVTVLSGIEAHFPARKVSVILGGSGSGKSTLLRHLIGLNRPKAGRVLLGGNDFFALPHRKFRQARRRMGVLFQDGALLGSLTLGQNVALPLTEHTNLKKAEIREIVAEKLESVGLSGFENHYPSQLSGGMRKRAGLARAIVAEPPLLLCDEPTSGLDPISSAAMDELLLSMRDKLGVTVVVVSHDLASLMAIADYVMVVNEGRAVFTGELPELVATKDPYLRQFLDRKSNRQEPAATER